MKRRLYFIGQGGSSWRDPRNWSRSLGGDPVRHLHARGKDVIVVGDVEGHDLLDLRGMPYAAVEITGYEGQLRLPDGKRLDFPKSWLGRLRGRFLMRRRVRPKMLRGLERNVAHAGGWQRSVRDGIATLVLTPRGWLVVPRLAGGAIGFVQKSTGVGGNGGGTGPATPTNMPAGSTQGNLLVATCSAAVSNSGGTFTCSDGTWTRAVQEVGRNNVQTAIFYKPNCDANETLPSFTYSNSSTHRVVVWEFSGVVKVSPLDRTASANGVGTALVGPNITATTGGTDVANGELVISSDAFSLNSNYTHTSSDTYNNGATPTGNVNNDSTSQRTHYRFAYGFTTSHAAADSNNAQSDTAGTSSVASTCIASFKVAINLTQTASLPYEALKGLAATGSEPYETLTGIAKVGAVDPYESLRGIANSSAEPYEALGGIRAIGALPYSALASLAVTGAMSYSTLLGLSSGAIFPYEALAGLAATASEPYETGAGVRSTGQLPYEALLELALSSVLPYETLAGLAATAGMPYSTISGLAVVAGLDYESLGGIAGLAELPYETRAGVTVSALAVISYEALEGVATQAEMPIEALLELISTAVLPYETLGFHRILIGVTDGEIVAIVGADGRAVVIAAADGEKVARAAADGLISERSASEGEIIATASTDGIIRP